VVCRHEAGVHRVQRVPATEVQGRLHTSTAAVVVLPEADEVGCVMQICLPFLLNKLGWEQCYIITIK
jgi:hypothetical protein